MISLIAERAPADKHGPDISDPLITAAQVAVERGRNEIDANCSNRELVTGAGPLAGFIRPGRVIEVADSEQQVWRGMVTGCSISISRSDGDFAADINVNIERVA